MVKTVKGNLLLDNKQDIICHQVNCVGVMGSNAATNSTNVAAQIRAMYPEVFRSYESFCRKHRPEELLGGLHTVETHDGRYVANVFGQLGYGTDKQRTDYDALRAGLTKLAEMAGQYHQSIAMPVGMGCGRGGGDWDNVVLPMIEEIFKDCDVVLYQR